MPMNLLSLSGLKRHLLCRQKTYCWVKVGVSRGQIGLRCNLRQALQVKRILSQNRIPHKRPNLKRVYTKHKHNRSKFGKSRLSCLPKLKLFKIRQAAQNGIKLNFKTAEEWLTLFLLAIFTPRIVLIQQTTTWSISVVLT